MTWVDTIPLVSQVKSLCQVVVGDKEGAKRTQEEFASFYSNLTDASMLCEGTIAKDGYCTKFRPQVLNPKWMSSLEDSVLATCVTMPGTHDSGCTYGGYFGKCQAWSIPDQLRAGIRFLDIRCKQVGDKFLVYHGIINCYLSFAKVIKFCEEFLVENPSEFIVVRVKREGKPYKPKMPFEELYKKYIGENPIFFKRNNTFDPVTVGQVRGKVLVLKDFEGAGLGTEWDFWTSALQDDCEPHTVEIKRYRILVHHHVSEPQDFRFHINFTSACTTKIFPKEFSKECNKLCVIYAKTKAPSPTDSPPP